MIYSNKTTGINAKLMCEFELNFEEILLLKNLTK